MTEKKFQPFTDRLSRDIRNDLSRSLVTVLKEQSISSAQIVGEKYLQENPHPVYRDYIENRLKCYARALAIIKQGNGDPLFQAMVLWDEQLFFEVHEILEHAWMEAGGDEKLFLQAMIRAAGVYIKLDAGYSESAAKIAAKAIPVLQKNSNRLAKYTEPARLIDALQSLATESPKLIGERIDSGKNTNSPM